jgi:hypothetical protein
MTEPTPRPTITQLEANWQVHLAGMRAEAIARQQGVSEEEGSTLLDAAGGGCTIKGFKFPPVHGGFMLMLSRVEEFAKKKPILGSDMGNIAALAFILGCPEHAWAMLRNADAVDLFEEAVTEFAMQFNITDLKQIVAWTTKELQRLKETGDDAGKPPAA